MGALGPHYCGGMGNNVIVRRLSATKIVDAKSKLRAVFASLSLILLISACGQVQMDAEATRELEFQAALSEAQGIIGVEISDSYEPIELADDSLFIEGRVYGSAQDGVVARLVGYDDGSGRFAVAWEATILSRDSGEVVVVDSAGNSRTISAATIRPQLVETESVVYKPSAHDPGDGGDVGICVEYCARAQRTYLVYTYSAWVPIVKYMTVAACAAAGGAVGGGVGGHTGAIACTILVNEIWKEKELIDWTCLYTDWACSTSPHRAPTVPKTKYNDIFIAGN